MLTRKGTPPFSAHVERRSTTRDHISATGEALAYGSIAVFEAADRVCKAHPGATGHEQWALIAADPVCVQIDPAVRVAVMHYRSIAYVIEALSIAEAVLDKFPAANLEEAVRLGLVHERAGRLPDIVRVYLLAYAANRTAHERWNKAQREGRPWPPPAK